jgi:hypothetical protein
VVATEAGQGAVAGKQNRVEENDDRQHGAEQVDDEGGGRAEQQLAQRQREDLVFRAQPGTPAPGGSPERAAAVGVR